MIETGMPAAMFESLQTAQLIKRSFRKRCNGSDALASHTFHKPKMCARSRIWLIQWNWLWVCAWCVWANPMNSFCVHFFLKLTENEYTHRRWPESRNSIWKKCVTKRILLPHRCRAVHIRNSAVYCASGALKYQTECRGKLRSLWSSATTAERKRASRFVEMIFCSS